MVKVLEMEFGVFLPYVRPYLMPPKKVSWLLMNPNYPYTLLYRND